MTADENTESKLEASVSEREYCETMSEVQALISTLPDSTGELNSTYAHLASVSTILAEEGSRLVPYSQQHDLSLNELSMWLEVYEFEPGSLNKSLANFMTYHNDVVVQCREIIEDLSIQPMEITLEALFPDGVYHEGAGDDHIFFQYSSLNNGAEIIDFDEWDYEATSDVLTMNLVCVVDSGGLSLGISRADEWLETKPFGPEGPIQFQYSLDDQGQQSGTGYFYAGRFFPFLDSISPGSMDAASNKAIDVFMSAKNYVKIRLDSAGSQAEMEFFLGNSERVLQELERFGCSTL